MILYYVLCGLNTLIGLLVMISSMSAAGEAPSFRKGLIVIASIFIPAIVLCRFVYMADRGLNDFSGEGAMKIFAAYFIIVCIVALVKRGN